MAFKKIEKKRSLKGQTRFNRVKRQTSVFVLLEKLEYRLKKIFKTEKKFADKRFKKSRFSEFGGV